ncbi:hypothetical protein PG999_008453 [Apiospora kogelbergensis]|uniref:AA1-like domain-containing protein n=1 Tax=Apiospora kogelbergensis TaxID=1337665 RepID=A0AAW0QHQ5_9PEZI
MKYTTAFAALLPLARTASINARSVHDSDIEFKISQFQASCNDANGENYHFHITINDDLFSGQECYDSAKTTDGKLPSVARTNTGAYAFTATKVGDGESFDVTVDHRIKDLRGHFTIQRDELKLVTSEAVATEGGTIYTPSDYAH